MGGASGLFWRFEEKKGWKPSPNRDGMSESLSWLQKSPRAEESETECMYIAREWWEDLRGREGPIEAIAITMLNLMIVSCVEGPSDLVIILWTSSLRYLGRGRSCNRTRAKNASR